MSDLNNPGSNSIDESHQHSPVKKSVLIVEDDWNSQKYYEHVLSPLYDLFTASTSGSAFSMIEEYSFDLILMDIMLIGEEDGLSLTRRIRAIEKYKSLPIIAISAYAYPEDKHKALDAGCTAFLSKPVNKDDLLNIIHKYLTLS